jgi:O-antigen/teichoic acid export membrane protein
MPCTGVRRSLAFSFLEKYSSLCVQFTTGLVVARLVTPKTFGVFAVAYAIVGFAHVIREMGVNSYLIQLPELEKHHVRAGLFATGIVAWSLGAALLLLCPLIGYLYGPDVRRATMILLLSFLIMPLSSTVMAVLQREMNFAALLRINLASTVAGSVAAVVLTAQGFGYMGLAWASVAGQLVIALLAACHRPHREHFMPSAHGAGQVFRFGSIVMLSSLLQQFSTNIASLITARFVSLEAMGLFTRGQSVTGLFGRLIMDGVTPLLLPILAKARRDGEGMESALWRMLEYLAVVTWPFFLFVALYAKPIVLVLFGEQWIATAELLRLMSIGGVFWLAGCIVPPLLTAIGKVRLTLKAQAINQTVAVAGVLIAAMQGIEAVAAAAILISAIHAVVWMLYLRVAIRIRWQDLRRVLAPAAGATCAALLLPAISLLALPGLAPLPALLIGLLGLGVGWLAAVFITCQPISAELLLAMNYLAGVHPRHSSSSVLMEQK